MAKNKKIAAAIAAAAIAAITSVTAFATKYSENYNLAPGVSTSAYQFKADNNYMLFYTRPSSPGPVELTIDGPGLTPSVHTTFPAQVTRSPEVIDTSKHINSYYNAFLTNPSSINSVSGTLDVTTSATKY